MAEIGQMEKAEEGKPRAGGKPKAERMEAEDTVEAFVQVGFWVDVLLFAMRGPCAPVNVKKTVHHMPAWHACLRIQQNFQTFCFLSHPCHLTTHSAFCSHRRPASAASSTPTLWPLQRRAAGMAVTTRE